jgi:hypothetical protein
MMTPLHAPGTAVSAPPLVHIKGVTKTFGGVRALGGVSLAVRAGEVPGVAWQTTQATRLHRKSRFLNNLFWKGGNRAIR